MFLVGKKIREKGRTPFFPVQGYCPCFAANFAFLFVIFVKPNPREPKRNPRNPRETQETQEKPLAFVKCDYLKAKPKLSTGGQPCGSWPGDSRDLQEGQGQQTFFPVQKKHGPPLSDMFQQLRVAEIIDFVSLKLDSQNFFKHGEK